jgi:hypothetical protein
MLLIGALSLAGCSFGDLKPQSSIAHPSDLAV